MTVGDKIKSLRKQAKLTQTELGQRLGVQKNAVSKWECGRVEDIPASKIKAMATLFDVPPSYLIDDEKDAPANGGVTDEAIKFALFGGSDGVTDEMYEEVRRFAAYLRDSKTNTKP